MARPKVGDGVEFDGSEYVVVAVDEETDSASLVPPEHVVQDIA